MKILSGKRIAVWCIIIVIYVTASEQKHIYFYFNYFIYLIGKSFISGMYGSNDFDEAKILAIFMTMEDVLKIPFDVVFEIQDEGEKVSIFYYLRLIWNHKL